MSKEYNRLEELTSSLKQERDELALRIHLGKAELKDEWQQVNDKLEQLSGKLASLKVAANESSEDVWAALKLVGEEVKRGFDHIRESL